MLPRQRPAETTSAADSDTQHVDGSSSSLPRERLAAELEELLLDPHSLEQDSPGPRAFAAPGAPTTSEPDGQISAAVLVPLYLHHGELRVVLTKRRSDLRRHAGEISFPGGRREPQDAALVDTALREAHEEIGLTRAHVRIVGALQRASTFATNYAIHPFVGLLDGHCKWRPSADEVAEILQPSLRVLRAGRTRTQIERRGFRFETDAYVFGEQLVWGATARILEQLLARVQPLLDRRAT